jgi:hypothetical protein
MFLRGGAPFPRHGAPARPGAVKARKRRGLARNAALFRSLATGANARIRLIGAVCSGIAGGDGIRADSRKQLSARKHSGAETADTAISAPPRRTPTRPENALNLHLRVMLSITL